MYIHFYPFISIYIHLYPIFHYIIVYDCLPLHYHRYFMDFFINHHASSKTPIFIAGISTIPSHG